MEPEKIQNREVHRHRTILIIAWKHYFPLSLDSFFVLFFSYCAYDVFHFIRIFYKKKKRKIKTSILQNDEYGS